MYKSILVPIDGSALSESALSVAAPLAGRHGAELHLVTVQSPPPSLVGSGGTPVADATLEVELKRAATEHLEKLRARLLASDAALKVQSECLEGRVAETLAARITERHHDLVVMTTHGRRGASRLWLGSVADSLVRLSPVPVLLLTTASLEAVDTGPDPFASVLVPLAPGDQSDAILADAVVLGGRGATYHLFTVVEPLPFIPRSPLDLMTVSDASGEQAQAPSSDVELAESTVAAHAEKLRGRGFTVSTTVVIHRHPAEAILENVRGLSRPLIAMATHGYGSARRLFIGSVADKVVRGSDAPVLLRAPGGS